MQLTLAISVIKTNHGMLNRTKFTVCSETHTKHVMWESAVIFWSWKGSGNKTSGKHWWTRQVVYILEQAAAFRLCLNGYNTEEKVSETGYTGQGFRVTANVWVVHKSYSLCSSSFYLEDGGNRLCHVSRLSTASHLWTR